VKAIADWVKARRRSRLMGNDVQNAELDKFNTLAREFGIQFNKDRKFEVINNDYKMGGVDIAPGNEIFKTTRKIYVKGSLDVVAVRKGEGDRDGETAIT
jgi:unsaturated rhamnogalacturonyl hydrolase